MNLAFFICVAALSVSVVTAALWACFAFWLRLGLKARGLLALLSTQFAFGLFLLIDGAPFNGVIFALFLLPLLALQALIVIVLEARDFSPR